MSDSESDAEQVLELTFEHDSMIAPAPFEDAPFLRVFTNFGKRRHLKPIAPVWTDASRARSKPFAIAVPVGEEDEQLPADASICFEAYAHMDCDNGMHVRARVGACSFLLADIAKAHGAAPAAPVAKPLFVFSGADDSGKMPSKGTLRLCAAALPKKPLAFKPPTAFSFLPENEQFLASTLRNPVARAILPFTEQAAAAGVGIDPSHPELRRVHAPFYATTAGVAFGPSYWILPGRRSSNNQSYFDNLIGLALRRSNRTVAWFTETVQKQFAAPGDDAYAYDDEFTECVRLVGEAMCIPSTSMPYTSDKLDLNERFPNGDHTKPMKHVDGKVEATEEWDNPFDRVTGDCEDFAYGIHLCFNGLRYGEWRPGSPAHLGQRIMKLYFGCGSLGSVLSAALGNDMKDAIGHQKPFIVGSADDENVRVGAHMWYEIVPAYKVVACLARTTQNLPENLELETPAWRVHLPHMVCEGTGRLDPLQRPRISYMVHASAAEKQAFIDRERLRRAAVTRLFNACETVRCMQVIHQQGMLEQVPNARIGRFYRRSTGFVTTDLFNQGFPVLEFLWAEVGERVPTPADADRLYSRDPLAAANRFQALPAVSADAGFNPDDWSDLQEHLAGADAAADDDDSVAPARARPATGGPHPLDEHNTFVRKALRARSFKDALCTPPRALPLNAAVLKLKPALGEEKIRYGANMVDRLDDRPLKSFIGIFPATFYDPVEVRAMAALFNNIAPGTLPGDDRIATDLLEASDDALKNAGVDAVTPRNVSIAQAAVLAKWADEKMRAKEFPTFEAANAADLGLLTLFFAREELVDPRVTQKIASELQAQRAAGNIQYLRTWTESTVVGRADVVLQMYLRTEKK